jgi:hypothetical protein
MEVVTHKREYYFGMTGIKSISSKGFAQIFRRVSFFLLVAICFRRSLINKQ